MLAYVHTHKFPGVVTRCSNNYGPYQFPEKFIPLMIAQAMAGERLPVYGKGSNVRDWIHVDDHCSALDTVLQQGREGEVYNIGGGCEMRNLEVAKLILKALGKSEELIQFVTDRPGHDLRYAINCEKLGRELGWQPQVQFDQGTGGHDHVVSRQSAVAGRRAQRPISRLLPEALRAAREDLRPVREFTTEARRHRVDGLSSPLDDEMTCYHFRNRENHRNNPVHSGLRCSNCVWRITVLRSAETQAASKATATKG